MEGLRKSWLIIVEVWEKGLFGIDISPIVVAAIIFFGFLLIRSLFSKIVICRLKALTKTTKIPLDDALDGLEKPIGLIPIILGIFFVTEYLGLSGKIELITDRIVRSLIVFVIFWSLVKTFRPLSFLLSRLEKILTAAMIDWLIKAIEIIFILIAVTTILEIWGIKVGTIIAGLGLFSVAVALGAKDLFRNLISGILVIAEKRFNPGDWIRIDGVVEGTVEHIGIRSTLVRRFDKAPTYVPNAMLADDSLINFSSMTYRRIYWMIGIEYRATIDQLRQIRDNIEQFILGSEEFSKPPEVPTFVRIDRFSDSSIDIMVYLLLHQNYCLGRMAGN